MQVTRAAYMYASRGVDAINDAALVQAEKMYGPGKGEFQQIVTERRLVSWRNARVGAAHSPS